MDKAKQDITVRAAHRGHSTRDIKKAKEIIASEEDVNVEELKAINDRLTRRLQELKTLDEKIRNPIENPELFAKEVEDALSFNDAVADVQFKIRSFLERGKQAADKQRVSQFQLNYDSVIETPPVRAHVKLPEITIKKFGGDPLEWLTFWDSFSEAIDKEASFSGIQKMNYLNRYLKGDAARAVSGLPLTIFSCTSNDKCHAWWS